MVLTDILFFASGLVLLILGAELLVRGASKISAYLGITPLVIGLTVVAFGTSSPEVAVSLKSSLSGRGDIALGNVIGSNIINVLLILGISAVITPLAVSSKLIRQEVPIMIVISGAVFAISANGVLSRPEGFILCIILFAYIVFQILQSKKEKHTDAQFKEEFGKPAKKKPGDILLNSLFVLGGLFLLIIGSRWLVDGSVNIAKDFGVSELVIALTIVAVGTSLPEVVTSVIASFKGEREIAVGNVVGSNIFNITGVLGASAAVSSGGLQVAPSLINFDLPIMLVTAVACLPIFFSGGIISRQEGLLFLFYYVAYVVFILMAASEHDALPFFSNVMLFFAIPLTLITLIVIALRQFRSRPNDGDIRSR